MRKLAVICAAAATVLLAGSPASKLDAETWRGAGNISGTAQNFTPIEPAACRAPGPHCRPGFTWVCTRWRGCWCRPCW